MPYPILPVIALAATAAGTGAQMAGQARARGEMDEKRAAEFARQQEYQRKASAAVQSSLQESTREKADTKLADAAQERVAAFNKIVTPPGASTPTTGNTLVGSPTATASSANNAMVAAWNRILGNAQAKLGAYSDWGLGQSIKDRRAAEELAFIGNNARGSAGVLGAELEDASHAGDGLGMAGMGLGTLGSLLGMYAATTPRAPRVVGSKGTVDLYNPDLIERVGRTA